MTKPVVPISVFRELGTIRNQLYSVAMQLVYLDKKQAEAVEVLAFRIDCILLDCTLPGETQNSHSAPCPLSAEAVTANQDDCRCSLQHEYNIG